VRHAKFPPPLVRFLDHRLPAGTFCKDASPALVPAGWARRCCRQSSSPPVTAVRAQLRIQTLHQDDKGVMVDGVAAQWGRTRTWCWRCGTVLRTFAALEVQTCAPSTQHDESGEHVLLLLRCPILLLAALPSPFLALTQTSPPPGPRLHQQMQRSRKCSRHRNPTRAGLSNKCREEEDASCICSDKGWPHGTQVLLDLEGPGAIVARPVGWC
jgi:hypothetical protein